MIRFLLDMGIAQSTGQYLKSKGHEATLSLERGALVTITESGKPVWKNDAFASDSAGITSGADTGDYITFTVGSGSYDFRLKGSK